MGTLDNLLQQKIVALEIMGLDVSITNGVITLWLATGLAFLFYFFASRRLRLVPGKLQNIAEVIVIFMRDEVGAQIRQDNAKWFPFLLALFSFILFNNLLGLVPGLGGSTTNINVTATLAILVFLVAQLTGVFRYGPFGYLRSFLPPGVPLIVAVFMVPVELVSQLAKPFSLAVRLFANMFAGHAVMLLVISLIFLFKNYLIIPLPILGNTAILIFEIFVSFIQAFVFTYLSALYIETAQEEHGV